MRFASTLPLAAVLLFAAGCDSLSEEEAGPPRTAEITKVTVLDAPLLDPAAGDNQWDGTGGGGPEIYFALFDDADDYRDDRALDLSRLDARSDANVVSPVSSSNPWYSDVSNGTFPLVWNVDPGYVVRNLGDPLYIALYDNDLDNDDPMAESEVFVLRDIAPATVTGQAQFIDLEGFDLNGDEIDDFSVRVTVEFFD